jgi:hypothetical protein
MKKFVLIMILIAFSVSITAQKKEKLKGNKNVIDVFKTLEAFRAIEIGDNLKVSISQTGGNGYHLTADENLIGDINFEVIDSVLKIYTTSKITSSKKLEVILTFKKIDKITITDNVKLLSKSKLIFDDFALSAFDNTSFELDLNAKNSNFNVGKNASGKIHLRGETSLMRVNENGYLKGLISLDELEIIAQNRSDLNLSGDVESFQITATHAANIKGESLKTSISKLNFSNKSSIQVYASKSLTIYAKDKSKINVYGHPEIKIDGLNDKAQVIKK